MVARRVWWPPLISDTWRPRRRQPAAAPAALPTAGGAVYFDPAWLQRDTPLGLAWAAGNTLCGRTAAGAQRAVLRRLVHAVRRIHVTDVWCAA